MSDIDNSAATDTVVPATGAPEAPAAAETTVAPATTQTEAPQGEPAPAEPKAAPEPPDWFVKEKSKLQRQRRDADRRAERLAAELAELRRSQVQPQRQSTELRPQDFPNYDAYVEAKIEAKTEEKIGAVRQSFSNQDANRTRQSQQEAFLEKAHEQAEATGIDMDAVLETLARPESFTVAVMNLITENEHTARLAEFFAENPSELDRVSRLGPALARKAVEKVAASFGASKSAPSVTNAPPPPPKVGGRTVTQKDWRQSDDMDTYAAGWKKDREAREST